MNPLLFLSGTALARKIRDREITSLEAVDAHIDHIRRVNPILNAVVAERFELARAEAVRADERTRSQPAESLPPFHGVPCTIKECFSLTGMPNSSGLVARKEIRASSDATAVARLREAGAIPLGVTNVSELCMWMETNNRVYGRTNNPYNPRHTVGGSSGGEGAIVGAGGAPFGLGADIGGSIRMPAFFNGVFGHKPTGGLVPGSGQHPHTHGVAWRYLTTGPLARRAEDLMPLVRLLAGPDGIDPECRPFQLGDPASVDFSRLKVVSVEHGGGGRVSGELLAAQKRVAGMLERRGASVREARLDRLKDSFEIWAAMLHADGGPSFSEMLGHGKPVSSLWQLFLWAIRRSPHTLPAILLAMLEKLPALTPGRVARMIAQGKELREELIELIGPEGVLLFPSFPSAAPRHLGPLWPPFQWVYTGIFNVMELPVTQVPLGLNPRGLPLGVQVAGVPGNDHLTIAVAMALEQDAGGWVPPSL